MHPIRKDAMANVLTSLKKHPEKWDVVKSEDSFARLEHINGIIVVWIIGFWFHKIRIKHEDDTTFLEYSHSESKELVSVVRLLVEAYKEISNVENIKNLIKRVEGLDLKDEMNIDSK